MGLPDGTRRYFFPVRQMCPWAAFGFGILQRDPVAAAGSICDPM